MSDLFHVRVPLAFIEQVFETMAACPQHRFQVLTNRAEHSLRYEQLEREDPPNSGYIGTACAVYLNFQVADTSGVNPWRDSLKVAPAGDTLILRFDPSGICGIPKCDTIHLVQVVRATGLDTLMNTRLLSYAEQAFPNAAVRDSERTAAGWRVDVTIEKKGALARSCLRASST